VYALVCSVINDDISLLSVSIFILGLAGLEYAVGIVLIIIFKNTNNKVELEDVDNDKKTHHIFKNSNLYLNRYI